MSTDKSKRRLRDRRRGYTIIASVLLIATSSGAYVWWQFTSAERAFVAHARQGKDWLSRVESFPSAGREHLSPGSSYQYSGTFPTSGPHDPTSTPPGFYKTWQSTTQLVHALEHGNIVIYYDEADPAVMDMLQRWAKLYDNPWAGLVVAPRSGLGRSIVLTAWTRQLVLREFDPGMAAAFIDAYRGRGPERPVR